MAVLLLANNAYAAQNYVFTPQSVQAIAANSSQVKNLPFGEYLRFYNLDTEQLNAEFINLSSTEESIFNISVNVMLKEIFNKHFKL